MSEGIYNLYDIAYARQFNIHVVEAFVDCLQNLDDVRCVPVYADAFGRDVEFLTGRRLHNALGRDADESVGDEFRVASRLLSRDHDASVRPIIKVDVAFEGGPNGVLLSDLVEMAVRREGRSRAFSRRTKI